MLKADMIKAQPEVIKFLEAIEVKDHSEDLFDAKAMISDAPLMVKSMMTYGIGSFFDFIIIALWMNLYFLLRTNRISKTKNNSKFSEQGLLNLTMPEYVKYGLVVAFSFYAIGEYFEIQLSSTLGFIGLNIIAAFYFMQGFGVYLKFLDFAKLSGFMRTFLIVLTIFSARAILVIVGFVDEFINFRKLMIKKDQGEL